jgi:hypothetical protein
MVPMDMISNNVYARNKSCKSDLHVGGTPTINCHQSFFLLPNCSLKVKLTKALQNCLMELKIAQKQMIH